MKFFIVMCYEIGIEKKLGILTISYLLTPGILEL